VISGGAVLTRGAIPKGIGAPGGTARSGWWQAEEKKTVALGFDEKKKTKIIHKVTSNN
jgi:hypothetical protein